MQELNGSFVALVSPMKSNGDIDHSSLKKLIDWHIEEGTDGIVSVTDRIANSDALKDVNPVAYIPAIKEMIGYAMKIIQYVVILK